MLLLPECGACAYAVLLRLPFADFHTFSPVLLCSLLSLSCRHVGLGLLVTLKYMLL